MDGVLACVIWTSVAPYQNRDPAKSFLGVSKDFGMALSLPYPPEFRVC